MFRTVFTTAGSMQMTVKKLRNYLPPEVISEMQRRASDQTATEFNGAGWLLLSENERRQLKRSI